MADNKLILHPKSPNIGIQNSVEFIADLHEIGLLDANTAYVDSIDGETSYKAGSSFLELIDFIEHRKAILLGRAGLPTKVDNSNMCSINVIDYGKKVSHHGFNSYTNNCYIQCPNCRFVGERFIHSDILSKWYEDEATANWQCRQCDRSWHVYDLNIGDGFTLARCAIDIWHIHYREAIPTQKLLNFLGQKTGGEWSYFYYRI